MKQTPWWQDGVIYQIYPRSFADGNGDGVGDLEGLISKLDYLNGRENSLGVDGLWLSPIYPSPMYDFGYDISDYDDIDARFGNLEQFERLVQAANDRGIRIIMDLVMNHTSHLHPWFVQARSSRDNPFRDFYLWQDPKPGGGVPNRWQAVFGGNAWEWDEQTAQYYYHMFLKEQPDLNWHNPAVVARLFQMIEGWMARGVHGFRLDVVNCYFKDQQLRNNPYTFGLRPFDWQRHVYDRDRPELLGLLNKLRQLMNRYPERMTVGEVFGRDPQLAAAYCGDGTDLLDQTFNFNFFHQSFDAAAFQRSILEWEQALHPGAWPCYVLNNHDFVRAASRHARAGHTDARVRVLAALLLTLRGTPYLYYGEELGLADTPIPRAEIQDPPGKRYWPFYKGRDAARTPMPWDSSPGAGFSAAKPWLRLNRDHGIRNVATQQADPHSIWRFYQRMLTLRRASVALRRGSWVPLQEAPGKLLCYDRVHEDQVMRVGLNFSDRRVRAGLDRASRAAHFALKLSSDSSSVAKVSATEMELGPYEIAIWEQQ